MASKPAKKPILTIDNDDIHNLLSFVNEKDTGKLTVKRQNIALFIETPKACTTAAIIKR